MRDAQAPRGTAVEDPATGELPARVISSRTARWTDAVRLGNESVLAARYRHRAVLLRRRTPRRRWRSSSPRWRAHVPDQAGARCWTTTKRVETLAPTLASDARLQRSGRQDRGRGGVARGGPRHAAGDGVHAAGARHGQALRGARGLGCEIVRRDRAAALPRSSGDLLPSSPAGIAVAVADRLDTLVGLFAVVGAPKATADPFGLRRAAYGAVQALVANGVRCDARAALARRRRCSRWRAARRRWASAWST